MESYLILLIIIVTLGTLVFILLKNNISNYSDIKKAEKVKSKSEEVIKKREDIQNEYDKRQDDIINSFTTITDGIMPNVENQEHNHTHSEPCSKSCPAYTGD